MKRLHVHLAVAELDRSIAFYSALFGSEPTLRKPDYARWMLEDPRVNFAISDAAGEPGPGVSHLGIQVEETAELEALAGRIAAADGPIHAEGDTTCCYAQSTKGWTADPDGIVWEAFLTHGDSATFGANPDLNALADAKADAGCCGKPE